MKKLQNMIIRSFILHFFFLAFFNAITNGIFDYFLEKYIAIYKFNFLILMTVGNLLVFLGSVFLVARHFQRQLKIYMDEEIREQVQREQILYSSIAHDLKTPMTIIKGYAQALSDGKVEQSKRGDTYRLIKDKTDEMVALLTDLMTYSGLLRESENSHKEMTDISACLINLVAQDYSLIENREVNLEPDIAENIHYPINPMDFKRIGENLLINAIKHNPPGVSVGLSLQVEENHVVLSVADSGALLKDDRIFEAFYKQDTSRSSTKGHGLGLAIVLKLVEKYRGEIKIEQPFAGYTKAFAVSLPLNKPLTSSGCIK
ncbi:hypothetical protein ING2D1G_1486 [Peptoniphilus sp. ING2-D1G]|nr:hypothetical protein ING2D1G_1486 [Peptoniphilus sp. ING2-D1G]